MERATLIHPHFPPGRRIIAVSDIHGNLPFFVHLMERIHLSPDDILVLVGDMLEKGEDSLALLRHLMRLSRTHTVYPLCGNCDGLVLRFFETDGMDQRFFASYLPRHPESTLRQMAREAGCDQTEDLPRLRRDLRAAFPGEWAYLKAMPTILETEHLLFVHGGVPSLEHMEQLNRWTCMKDDDFLGQGHSFSKWVIVGHWPVTLYNEHIQSSAPLILPERKIKPEELDAHNEVSVASWTGDIRRWHDHHWDPRQRPYIQVDNNHMSYNYLTGRENWALCPASIAVSVLKKNPDRVAIRRLETRPPRQICYMVALRATLRTKPDVIARLQRCLLEYAEEAPWLTPVQGG